MDSRRREVAVAMVTDAITRLTRDGPRCLMRTPEGGVDDGEPVVAQRG
jgi:hypothetical protein